MSTNTTSLPTLKDIFSLSADVISLANAKNMTLGTAESCTGGLIGAAITAIPGSSSVFKGGIIAYANEVKIRQLNVSKEILDRYGAVSELTAKSMARNARDILDVNIAISVTGIAGPGGGTIEKPVGTVWMGIATKNSVDATLFQFGDIGRNKVRDVTCYEALQAFKDRLENE